LDSVLINGTNLIAIHGEDTGGGNYLDVRVTYDQPSAGTAPSITSANNATFTAGTYSTFTVTTTGTPTPTLTGSGHLVNSLTFTDNGDGTATLAGIPLADSGGTYALTLTAHNGVGSDATQNFTLTVDETPAITSADHYGFTEGMPGSFTVTTRGFPTP